MEELNGNAPRIVKPYDLENFQIGILVGAETEGLGKTVNKKCESFPLVRCT